MVRTDRRTRGLASAVAGTLLGISFFVVAGSAGADGTVMTVCPAAGPGCDHTSVQSAIDAAAPNDTVLVRPGTYAERISIAVANLTVCGATGATCSAAGADAILDAPNTGPAVGIAAADVRVSGIAIGGDAEPLVSITGSGAMLRRNAIDGPVLVSAAAGVADLRLNQWGTNDWSEIESMMQGAGTAMAAPILRADRRQDPPLPTVDPSGHCTAMGFTPRFVEEAVWCAHAGGSIVFHPSANPVDPTPHGAFGGSETITIDRNKILVSVDMFGEPTFGADDEVLAGLTLCSAPGGDSAEPPTPELGDCGLVTPARAGTVLDSQLGPATTLDLIAPEVTVENLTIRNTDMGGSGGQAVRVTGPDATLTGNLIDGNLAGGGDPLADQMGITLRAGGIDYTIAENEIRNWAHAGIWIGESITGKGTVGPDNVVRGNGRSGLLIAHRNVAARDTLITGNQIGPNGLRGINLEASDGTIIEENDISLDLITVDGLAPGTGAGVWVQGADGARIRENTMNGNDVAAVVVNDLGAFEPSDLVMNRNDMPGNSFGLSIGNDVSGLIVDATRNHWGRYTREGVAASVQPATGNEIDISCFLSPTGAELCPPVPVIEVPADGSTTTNPSVVVEGSNAEADSVVSVFEGVIERGSGVANALGDWETDPAITFSGGAHAITARSEKNTGGIITRSEQSAPPVNFSVDITPVTALVDCDAFDDDITEVQRVVNVVADPAIIRLKGTCDFSAAAAHGGDATSIQNTAILIRPANPFAVGLTIESDVAPQSATVLGSGTQAAFTVAPGNANVQIRGLRFVNFARPLVAVNSRSTTFGDAAGAPASATNPANRIVGASTMREGVLGLAVATNPASAPSGTVRINYGPGGASTGTFTGQSSARLEDLKVLGNYISYNPPGPEDGVNQVTAITVRQRFANVVNGVLVEGNAVGMFSSEFPTSNMSGVLMHSFNSVPTSGPNDYLIRNVEIDGNNLGRLEELGMGADVHATGRTGIVLIGVSNFVVTDNGVRVRLSPTGIPMPGGGIIVSDSGFGRVGPGNSSIVLADPSVGDSDMGAYAVVEDYSTAFSSGPKAQSTTNVELRGNRIGAVGGPGIFARRGLVVTDGAKIVAHDNDFEHTSEAAVNLGVDVVGPGSIAAPGPITLPKGATDSVVCQNNLDGTVDDDAEVDADAVTSAAFPGGSAIATNTECTPTLSLSPTTLNASSGDLDATGIAWPNRPIEVTLTDQAMATRSASTTAGADGTYSLSFPATGAGWAGLANGTLTGVARASDGPTGIFALSDPANVLKDTELPAAPTIDNPLDGSIVPPSFTVSGTGPASHALRLKDAGSTIATTTISGSGTWSVTLNGQAGALALRAFSVDASANESFPSNLVNLTIDASVPAPPVILVPFEDEVVPTNNVTISGTAAPGHTVEVRKFSPAPLAFLGSTVADGAGTWSIATTLPDGLYQVRAIAINGVNTPSAPAVRNFRVNTDFVAPLPPTIITPPSGSLQPTLVTISGEAEIGALVTVEEGSAVVGRAKTQANGRWSFQALMAAGPHTITAYATDAGGNDSADTPARSFRVDGQRPRATITTANLTPFIGAPVIEGTASDDSGVASVEVEVLSATGQRVFAGQATLLAPNNNQSLWSIETPGIGTGIFTVRASSVDVAGNRSGADSVQIIVIRG